MRGINIKVIHKFMNISRVLIGLINETLRYFPLGLVTIFVVLFILFRMVFLVILFMNGKKQMCQERYILFVYG